MGKLLVGFDGRESISAAAKTRPGMIMACRHTTSTKRSKRLMSIYSHERDDSNNKSENRQWISD